MAPATPNDFDVINPANETAYATISLGSKADVEDAVEAASKAFSNGRHTGRTTYCLDREGRKSTKRIDEMAKAISEMGAPMKLATNAQAAAGLGHIKIPSLTEKFFL